MAKKTEKPKTMLGWHCLRPSMRTACGHEPAWRVREVRSIIGRPQLCIHGYHACRQAPMAVIWWDAVGTGLSQPFRLCRVRLSGLRIDDQTKSVAHTRKLIWALSPSETRDVMIRFRREMCAHSYGRLLELAWDRPAYGDKANAILERLAHEAHRNQIAARKK